MKYLLLLCSVVLSSLCSNAQTPVAYYPFSGNANDAIGTLNGTVNGATLTTDRFGNANSAYSFDGVGDNIVNGSLNFANNNYTISGWIKNTNTTVENTFFSAADPLDLTKTFILIEFNYGIIRFLHRNPSGYVGGVEINSIQALQDNQWYHIACVKESNTLKMFINGILEKSITDAGVTSITENPFIEIGRLRNSTNNFIRFFNGSIDEVKIYNTALTHAQVQNEYSASAYGSQFGNSVQLTAGNDDYIQILTSTLLSLSGNVTVEAWINMDPPSTANNIFMNCVNGGFGYALFPSVFATVNSGNPQNANNGVSIPSGAWHHVAGVKKDAGINSTFNYYVDGILTGQGFGNANAMRGGGTNDICRIGRTTVNTENFKGRLDEIRVWNTARTQGEIAANMLLPLSGNEPGLLAYYDMNRSGQGAGLTVDNKATATGAALNGTTVGTATTPVFGPGFTQQKPGSGNSIEFSTSSSTNIIANNIALNNRSFTIDFWLKKKVLNNTDICFSQGTMSGNSGLAIGYYNGSFIFSFYANDLYATTTDDLNWHHWTCVYDKDILSPGNNRLIYRDGILVGQDRSNDFNGTGNFNIGIWLSGAVKGLDGQLDEVRIWNTALTQTQIRDHMCRKIIDTDPLYSNLIAYYNFDESTGNTAFDGTANANNGTIINNPTRLTSGASIGNASAHDYVNATKTASIAHTSGESFTVTSSTGNPAGLHVYLVNEQPNILTGTAGVGANDKYFGVFQVNGSSPAYQAVYNYNGNPFVTPGIASQLRLYKRADNAATSWSFLSASPDEPNNTITVTGESTEYILGKLGFALPLNLISFTGNKQNSDALLQWKTANEINVSHFEIQRSDDGQSFVPVGTVSSGGSSYAFTDVNIFSSKDIVFYRLKLIDVDGRFTTSAIVRLSNKQSNALTVYPNPAKDILTVSSTKKQYAVIVNAVGQQISKIQLLNGSQTIDISAWANGIYFIITEESKLKFIKQL